MDARLVRQHPRFEIIPTERISAKLPTASKLNTCHREEGPGDEAIPKAVRKAKWMLLRTDGDRIRWKPADAKERSSR